jgi:hypothetical protein
VNRVVDIRLEDLVDDLGIAQRFSREEFDVLLVEFNESIRSLFNAAIAQANLTRDEVDSIELIGGVTHVPYVKEVSGLEKLNQSMNSDEALALGAGYVGAAASSVFIVLRTVLTTFAHCNTSIVHGDIEIPIFNETSTLRDTFNYTYQASDNGKIFMIVDGEPLMGFQLALPENTTENATVNLFFNFGELTLPQLARATVDDTELTNITRLKPAWVLTADELQRSRAILQRMDEILEERRRLHVVRNNYESYIYDVQDKINFNPVYQKVVNETVREEIVKVLGEHRQWIGGEHDAPLNESIVQKKFDELKDATRAVEKRATEYQKRAPAWQNLNNSLNHVFRTINDTWPVAKPWLTEGQVLSAWNQYNRTRTWFDEKYALQLNRSDYEDPVVSVAEIDTQKLLLEWNFNNTDRIRKPVPTPEPTPELNETDINGTDIDATDDVNATDINVIEGVNGTDTPVTDGLHMEEIGTALDDTKGDGQVTDAKRGDADQNADDHLEGEHDGEFLKVQERENPKSEL